MAKKVTNNELYVGGETWENNLMMTLKTVSRAVLFYALPAYLAAAFAMIYSQHKERFVILNDVFFGDYDGLGMADRFSQFIHRVPKLPAALAAASSNSKMCFVYAAPVLLIAPMMLYIWKRHSEKVQRNEYIEGARLITVDQLKSNIGDKETNVELTLAATVPEKGISYEPKDALKFPALKLGLPRFIETRNFALIGKAGSGKSTVLFQFAKAIIKRGDAAFYHDPHGDFVSRFYSEKRGDIIFNPFDARFTGWTIFNDMKRITDFDTVANVLIPDPKGGADPYFFVAPRQILTAILLAVSKKEPNPKNQDVINVLKSGGYGIKDYIMSTSPDVANLHLHDPESKTAASLLSVLLAFTKPLEYLTDGPFSITGYLADPRGRQVFITNQADLKAALKPINTVLFEVLGTRLLSLEPDENRRTWIVLDEVFALNKLKVIERLPVEGRKFGVSLILGAQDFSQGDELYTPALRRSIFNSLSSVFYFAVQDTATAKEISDTIGTHEFTETQQTLSMGLADSKDGTSVVRQRKTENLVQASVISSLRVFEHFLKVDGYDYCRTLIIPETFPTVAPTFVEADGLDVVAAHQAGAVGEGVVKTGFAVDTEKQDQGEKKTEGPTTEQAAALAELAAGLHPAILEAADITNDPAPDHGPEH